MRGWGVARDPATSVADDDVMPTVKTALAHLDEPPDYYAGLAEVESHAGGARGPYGATIVVGPRAPGGPRSL